MELGKCRTYLKTARGSSVVDSEGRIVWSRERCCERMCWHKNVGAKMTCSKLDFIQRGASRGSGRSLEKITEGQLSGWIGGDDSGVRETGQ